MSPAGSRWRRDRRSSISLRIEGPAAAHCGSISISKAAVASSSRASASRSHCPRPMPSPSTSAASRPRTSSSSSSSTRAVTTSGATRRTPSAFPPNGDRSDDGTPWNALYSATRPGTARSYVYLPHGTSRRLRLRLHEGVDGQGIGIAEIDVRPYEFSRTLDAFFQSIAANEPRGLFPRYLCGEQTYWTSVGSARGGVTQALLNEEGMLEVDRGAFSIEPFLYVDDKLVTWADGSPTQDLEEEFLPIPSSVWRKDGIVLRA